MKEHYPGQTTQDGIIQKVLGAFPWHDEYHEVCAGTCQALKRKQPIKLSYVVDLNADVVKKAIRNYTAGKVKFVNCDAVDYLRLNSAYFSKDAFIYLDPPWRIERKLYLFKMTDEQHVELLEAVKEIKQKVAILNYTDPLYDQHLTGWHSKDMQACYSGHVRSVSLYTNYDPDAVKLHLPTLAGKNRTDRQRAKRKAARWLENYKRLPFFERELIQQGLDKYRVK